MKTRIEARWQGLVVAPDVPTFQLLDSEHPLDLYIGKTMSGEPLFLVVDAERPPPIRGMRAIEVSSSQRTDGRWNLLLALRAPALAGIFALLCEDLASSSRHLGRGVPGMTFIARRLRAWRQLVDEGSSGLLSAAEVRGLLGELTILEKFISSGMNGSAAVQGWVGPLGADQDFTFPGVAWEIKTTPPDVLTINIASERQLNSTVRELRLVVLVLEGAASDEGRSLNEQVDAVRSALQNDVVALDLFEERLKTARYVARGEYDLPRLRVVQSRTFSVNDPFPRIRPQDLPKGVQDVNYQLRLEACAPFLMPDPVQWS